MAKNGKDTKHTRHISRQMNLVRNVEEENVDKKVWCKVGLQLEDTGTNNVRKNGLIPGLGYDMVRLDN